MGTTFPPFVCGKAEMSAAGGEVTLLAATSRAGDGGRATSSFPSRGSLLDATAGDAAARAARSRDPRSCGHGDHGGDPWIAFRWFPTAITMVYGCLWSL